jgi:uncharacterized protein (TIGR00251 family)
VRRRRPGRGDDRRAPELSLVEVRLQPRAGRDEIVGERNGRILVRVGAAPLEGAANAALCKLIAKRLRVARGRVTVVRGERNRDKTVMVDGLAGDDVRRRLLA